MNKKLKDDYIKFTLSLNTSEAREELNRLNASSRELQRTNDGLRNSMTELVASGKKGSDEYKRLEAELKSNSKAISDNNAKVKILRSSMKSTEKTYAELAKEARGLQKQLDNTELGKLLIDGAMAKMSDTSKNLLNAAGVDISAIIRGAGEALIARMK